MYKLSRAAIEAWLSRVNDFVVAGNTGVYAENALNEIARDIDLRAWSYGSDFVNEVDTLDDLAVHFRGPAAARLRRAADPLGPAVLGAHPGAAGPGASRAARSSSAAVAFSTPPSRRCSTDAGSRSTPVFSATRPTRSSPRSWPASRSSATRAATAIIAVGGGSAMDVAKCIKFLASDRHDGVPRTSARPGVRIVPQIAVPTTAGTGSIDTLRRRLRRRRKALDRSRRAASRLRRPRARLLRSLPDYHKKATCSTRSRSVSSRPGRRTRRHRARLRASWACS